MKRTLAWLCSAVVLLATADAREVPQTCGTYRGNSQVVLQLHQRYQRQRQLKGLKTLALRTAATTNYDVGDLAVIDDSGGVITDPTVSFDLGGKTVSFLPQDPAATRYHFATTAGGYDAQLASGGQRLNLGDDDARRLPLPFEFPFYGQRYQQVFVNSDGNLTFTRADVSYDARSLGRMFSGPPRIAPLFDDLDPSITNDPSGVRYLSEADRFTVSWVTVPEYGYGLPRTFQASLFPDGHIELSWIDSGAFPPEAVVGISPGGAAGSIDVVSFTSDASGEYTGTVADRFSYSKEVDMVLAAQKFYQTHDDAYDYLVFYNTLNVAALSGAVAYESTVRTFRDGIGDTPINVGARFGSASRLQAVINLGNLKQYSSPNGYVVGRAGTGDTPMSIIAHEMGHLFLALASVRDPGNPDARPMLNPANLAHWSFVFNSDASFLEGNRIVDDGASASQRFRTTETVNHYSLFDQYLMGLRPPEEVPPSFLVVGSGADPSMLPWPNHVIGNGMRRDISIGELISAEGRRAPDSTMEQKNFRVGFVVIARAGVGPSQDDLDKVEQFRGLLPDYISKASDNLETVDTALKKQLELSTFPSAGVLLGQSLHASIEIGKPAGAPLEVQLQSSGGAFEAPATVTIPAGATSAEFTIQSRSRGEGDLIATTSNAAYEVSRSKIQVLRRPPGISFCCGTRRFIRRWFCPDCPCRSRSLSRRSTSITFLTRACWCGRKSPETAPSSPRKR